MPSPEQIEAAKTPGGGWDRKTLADWGVRWPPPKGWKKRLAEEHQRAGADQPQQRPDQD